MSIKISLYKLRELGYDAEISTYCTTVLYYAVFLTIKHNAWGYMTTGHGQTTNQEYGLKRCIDIRNPQLSAHRIRINLGAGTSTTDRHTGTQPYM